MLPTAKKSPVRSSIMQAPFVVMSGWCACAGASQAAIFAAQAKAAAMASSAGAKRSKWDSAPRR